MRDQRRPQQSRSIRAILSSAILIGTSSIAACGLVDGSEQSTAAPTGFFGYDEVIGQSFAPPSGTIKCFFHDRLGEGRVAHCEGDDLCVPKAPNGDKEVRSECVEPGTLGAGEACAEYGTGKQTAKACKPGLECRKIPKVLYLGIDPYDPNNHDPIRNSRYDGHYECVEPDDETDPPDWSPAGATTSTTQRSKTFSRIKGAEHCDLRYNYVRVYLNKDRFTATTPGPADPKERYQPECVPRGAIYDPAFQAEYCDGDHAMQALGEDGTCTNWRYCLRDTVFPVDPMDKAPSYTGKDGVAREAEAWFEELGTSAQCGYGSATAKEETVTARTTNAGTYCTRKKTWSPEAIENVLMGATRGNSSLGAVRFACENDSRWCTATYERGRPSDFLRVDFERAPGRDTVHIRYTGNGDGFQAGITKLKSKSEGFDLALGECPDEDAGAPAPVEDRSSPAEPPQTAADDSKDDKDLPWWKKGTNDLSWMDQDRG